MTEGFKTAVEKVTTDIEFKDVTELWQFHDKNIMNDKLLLTDEQSVFLI